MKRGKHPAEASPLLWRAEAKPKRDVTIGPMWLKDVEEHDFDAAYAYLSLRLNPTTAARLVDDLRDAKVETRRANDILRACDREPLPLTDAGVRHTLAKVIAGKPLSPILVVSFKTGGDIADGYHRVSTTYQLDPFGDVPLRIASI